MQALKILAALLFEGAVTVGVEEVLEVGDLGSEFFAFVGVGNSQEDVLYHVLSLTIITQQDSGQMNHLAIVPAEKLFEYSNVTGGGQ